MYLVRVKRFLRRGSLRDQPAYREMVLSTLPAAQVISILTRYLGVKPVVLKQRRAQGVIRGMVAELLHKYSELSQRQIGALLGGIDYGAVYLLRCRLREWMLRDLAIYKQFTEIEKKVYNECREV